MIIVFNCQEGSGLAEFFHFDKAVLSVDSHLKTTVNAGVSEEGAQT